MAPCRVALARLRTAARTRTTGATRCAGSGQAARRPGQVASLGRCLGTPGGSASMPTRVGLRGYRWIGIGPGQRRRGVPSLSLHLAELGMMELWSGSWGVCARCGCCSRAHANSTAGASRVFMAMRAASRPMQPVTLGSVRARPAATPVARRTRIRPPARPTARRSALTGCARVRRTAPPARPTASAVAATAAAWARRIRQPASPTALRYAATGCAPRAKTPRAAPPTARPAAATGFVLTPRPARVARLTA
jgi:hypothetical protein